MGGWSLASVVVLLLSAPASAVECPPGFLWKRMSGVGCVQEDCVKVGGSYGYTENCFCRVDRGCYEAVDYQGFDPKKCHPFCPGSRLYGCVESGTKCPHEIDQELAAQAAAQGLEYDALSEEQRTKMMCDTKCKNEWGLHAVWDGQSPSDGCWCGCEIGYYAAYERMSNPKYGMDTRTKCVAEDCAAYCADLGKAYVHKKKSSTKESCECGCADGYAENYPYGFCVPQDELMSFPVGGQCHGTTDFDKSGLFGDICSCRAGLANCDRNNNNGCETDTMKDRLNCAACGRMCPAGRICFDGFCWGEEFREVFERVDRRAEQDQERIRGARGDGDEYVQHFKDPSYDLLQNQAEYLWSKLTDMLAEAVKKGDIDAPRSKNVMQAVDYFLDYVMKPKKHYDVRVEVDRLVGEGKIDGDQARWIKGLDAFLKASSLVVEHHPGDAGYPQSAWIDQVTESVVNEAVRGAKYRHCADLLDRYDLNTGDPKTQKLVDECLERQASAGIFR